MLLNDKQIINKCLGTTTPMIYPFVAENIKMNSKGVKVISYGVSSYGYDIRMAPEFKLYESFQNIDPKDPNSGLNWKLYTVDNPDIDYGPFETESGCRFLIPENSVVLSRSIEYFKLPTNIEGICMGKSTYARNGIHVLMTPLEAGWEGHLTLEIANLNPFPTWVYANEGIAQILFIEGEDCYTSYADRAGKYQGQTGVTVGRL